MKKRIFLVSLALLSSLAVVTARADEGMWMVNAISRALEADMQARGLLLQAGEIYNADAEGTALCDAVVSLDFGCTGSVISDKGLVITNHHCAYSDVYALSTREHNYLEDGFWAFTDAQEIPIPDKSIQFLKKVINVTAEVEEMVKEAEKAGAPLGSRKLSFQLEKKYSEQTGLEASLYSMWSGSEYYMALYQVYTDIRLVAAPPVSIAAYGGDVDNWEWPQHKCDFALYRIYTAPDGSPAEYSKDNVPLKPVRHLDISLDGYKEGDFAMVIGYPGSTDRYASSAKVSFEENLQYPISNQIRAEQMAIIKAWMDRDPEVRLKYSDSYFMLSNIQENNEGMVQCFTRFGVAAERASLEKDLQAWIDADAERKSKWGSLIKDLDATYDAVSGVEANLICFRETIIRGTKLGVITTRLNSLRSYLSEPRRVELTRRSNAESYSQTDLRVEKSLFRHAVGTFYTNVDSLYWGEYQKDLFRRYRDDMDGFMAEVWEGSRLTDEKGIAQMLTLDGEEMEPLYEDPLFRFLQEVKVTRFNDDLQRIQGASTLTALGREYTHALYQMRRDKGEVQYPDANSSMRITYGTVGGYEPRDGILCSWYSSPKGILEKYDPDDYDFNLKPDWKELLDDYCSVAARTEQFNANFLTDNDITGGNSGSPVLDAKGRLIGLAFDGNKESLASDVSFTPGYNKCVNVDIRFVVWTLRHYAHLDRILEETNLNQ